MPPPPDPLARARRAAAVLTLAAHPVRVRLLLGLLDGPAMRADLAPAGVDGAAFAHHLSLLRWGGLVDGHPVGKTTRLELTPRGRALVDSLLPLFSRMEAR